MIDETVVIASAADTGGGADTSSAIPPASVSDTEFLNQPETAAVKETSVATEEEKAVAPEEINLSAIEEGQPEWLAKITDPAAKVEVEKLLTYQKSFSERFKDAADLDEFFKELPGGREQVAALQTLSKEVSELDGALESNTPDGLAGVAERYLAMTPDGGINLLRAAAQHMAKASPESWNQISSELVNSTLRASGIGADLAGIVSAISAMRAAAQAEKWEDFGAAAGKILGTPKEEPKPDVNLARLAEREQVVRAGEQKAQSDVWSSRREAGAGKITTHVRTEAGKTLAKVLPASISDKDRGALLDSIVTEVASQLSANAWTNSQVNALIGQRTPDGKGGFVFSKAILTADQKAFDQAAELFVNAASHKMITAAVAKIVSEFSSKRAVANQEERNRAKGASARTDVGAGKVGASGNGRQQVSAEQLRARNADGSLTISDKDFLNL